MNGDDVITLTFQPPFERCRLWPAVMLLAGSVATLPARALEFATDDPDLKLRWDNTVKYSAAVRVEGRDPLLVSDINQDDGDRNFGKGLISNRLDLLSEADLTYRDVGMRLSAAAWYDSVYNRGNDNNSAGLFGPDTSSVNSTGAYNEFLPSTRTRHGRDAEVLDAFVFGKAAVGGMPVRVRLGRFAQLWGESLFFGSNAVAGAMTPVDVVKLVSVPNSQFKETVLQVPQVAVSLQFTPDLSVNAYYQFRYRPNRFPGVGSYFSVSDTTEYGGQSTFLGPTAQVPTSGDEYPKNSGQGGVQVRFSAADTDFGIFLVRFHDKSFQVVPTLGIVTPPGVVPPTVAPTSFRAAFQQGITTFGASFSRTFGDANVAGEVSVRDHMDLASTHGADASALAPPGAIAPSDNADNPAYAVGRTLHANLSTLWTVPRTALWQEASFAGEVAWNRVLSCRTNCSVYSYATNTGVIDPNSTRDAVNLRGVFAPSYRQVLPGLDLSVPIGIGWAPKGSRSRALGAGASIADGGGDLSLGVSGSYLDVWRFSLSATHFYGAANTFLAAPAGSPPGTPQSYSYGQALKDRDFVALSLARTF
jgi:hypothetical protein